MKKLLYVLATALCLVACEKNTEGGSSTKGDYVDLGLASGTQWKNVNEMNPNDAQGFYTYDEAMSLFEKNLPTYKQLEELRVYCIWTWMGNGYKVEGPNGESIFLPAAGCRRYDGTVGSGGNYWSATLFWDSKSVYRLDFYSGGVEMAHSSRDWGLSVRLVR